MLRTTFILNPLVGQLIPQSGIAMTFLFCHCPLANGSSSEAIFCF